MLRKIIKIDKDKCNGCELCVKACHEGAIGMENGKAKLLRDDYCDGLGDCLPVCPTGAITFEEREALEYNEEEVKSNMKKAENHKKDLPCGCPGTNVKSFNRPQEKPLQPQYQPQADQQSHLRQWPVQIKLVPTNASYFNGANLLIAADCSAYAYANFHRDFIRNHITLIGCPKLDAGEYVDKLTEILKNNAIKSVKVVRMEVPCCGGIASATIAALKNSEKMIPWQIVTIGTDGSIVEN